MFTFSHYNWMRDRDLALPYLGHLNTCCLAHHSYHMVKWLKALVNSLNYLNHSIIMALWEIDWRNAMTHGSFALIFWMPRWFVALTSLPPPLDPRCDDVSTCREDDQASYDYPRAHSPIFSLFSLRYCCRDVLRGGLGLRVNDFRCRRTSLVLPLKNGRTFQVIVS